MLRKIGVSVRVRARVLKHLLIAAWRFLIRAEQAERRREQEKLLKSYREMIGWRMDAVCAEELTNKRFSQHASQARPAGLYIPVFRHANLKGSDLTGVRDIRESDFAGADLAGTQLPEGVLRPETLKIVEERCRNAGKVFLTLLLACAFTWLTVGMTRDAALLTNAGASQLPIINVEVPIVGYYAVAPLLVLGIYGCLHLYLQRLWEAQSKLPAVFPDGRTLDEVTYPWLVNDFVVAYLPRLRGRRAAYSFLQQ